MARHRLIRPTLQTVHLLANHREVIAAIDFFTVPTATFRVLYVFFAVHHARRALIHFRVSGHPTAAWIKQPLREALPCDQAPRYLILDRDARYGNDVLAAIRHMGIEPRQITARSPWQNGKDAHAMRAAETRPDPDAEVIGRPRRGGFHHRYGWRPAA